MTPDNNDGQPSIEQLSSEGVSMRKCIAQGTEYGGGSGAAPKSAKGGSSPKPALAGMRMKGGKGY